MYLSHFGLRESPFGITPNPAFFYAGNTRGEILQALLYAVGHGEGIVKVTGEVGSGKTMLCRMLERQLPPHIEVIYLVNPSLSPLEALFAIASELDLQPGGKRSDEVLRELHADLIAKHSAGRQVVLLVEEAQAMPLATLEEIRLLTNLETAHHKLLQIVLFGQPELDQHLNLPSMRQLKERITHSFEVPPLPSELLPEFLACRLRAAGYQGPPLFSPEAVRRIARSSQGIVRRINILADKAMLAAYAADARGVGAQHVEDAVRESAFGGRNRSRTVNLASIAFSVLIVVLLAATAWLVLKPQPQASAVATAWRASMAPAAAPRLIGGAPAQPAGAMTQTAPATLAQAAPANGATATPAAAVPAQPRVLADAVLPAAEAAVATPPAIPAPRPLLQQTLRATHSWLRDAPDTHLSLLILTVPVTERDELEQFLSTTRAAIGLEQIHAYPVRQAGQDCIAITYGSFASHEQAEAAVARLADRGPDQPQIRTIRAIRADVARGGLAW